MLNGERATAIEGFEDYLITESEQVWNKKSGRYLTRQLKAGRYVVILLKDKRAYSRYTDNLITALTGYDSPEAEYYHLSILSLLDAQQKAKRKHKAKPESPLC